jgi:DNA-binding NarL/FixJ family response regulator
MEPFIHKDKRRSQRVPVQLRLQAQVDGCRVALQSENISIDGMFLSSKEFIRPCAGFFARIWLPAKDEPLQVYLTSCFTEQTWSGYGIGVHISGISSADRAHWEAFYRRCIAEHAAQLRRLDESAPAAQSRRILVIDGAVDPLAMQALRKQGLVVSAVESVERALEQIQALPIAAVVSDVRHPGADGLALCCAISVRHLPTRTVLLTDSDKPKDFLLGLFAGATRVIAKSYSHDMLVNCILEVLQEPLPGTRVGSAISDRGAEGEHLSASASEGLWDLDAETVDSHHAA